MKTLTAFAGFALLLVGTPALAQGTSAQRAACTPDVFRLCSSHIPSVAQITSCLKREKPNLSAGCRAAVDTLDKPTTTVATRSIVAPKSEWCRFDRNEASADMWKTWCGGTAWSE